MELKVGTTIEDRYQVTGYVGEGGMATVYLVEHCKLKSTHALKLLHITTRSIRERLLQEGQIQSNIKHTNIVSVTDVVTYQGSPGLVMEFIEGPTLRQLMDHQRLSLDQVDTVARGLMAGIGVAHKAGMIHRDLKPANVLMDITPTGLVPKIADFGLAKHVEAMQPITATQTGMAMGTPAFMAPEQIRDAKTADHRADLFSLGVILYEMVTGNLPFAGESPLDVFQQIVSGDYEPPESVEPRLPIQMARAIKSALETDRDKRVINCGTLYRSWTGEAAVSLVDSGPWKPEIVKAARSLISDKGSRTGLFPTDMEQMAPTAEVNRPSLFEMTETIESFPVGSLADLHKHNLPRRLDAFVGRGHEIADLAKHMVSGDARLLTLLGPGGTGKTRLSQQFGSLHLPDFPGGIWFCDLTEATTLEELLSATGRALEIPLTGKDPLEQLGHVIRGREKTLLIFDNAEQVVDDTASALEYWLQNGLEARFLVTSRRRLDIEGEVVYPLGPLPEDDAVDLFEQRAITAKPGFSLTDQNRKTVVEIVERLDCMSLAIELAAARVRLLPPQQILKRLKQRFKLLSSKGRGKDNRQASLRGAIDWSWQLLTPWEQSALAQCSVFRGGFTLESAEAILDLSAFTESPYVMDVVQNLLEHSLLRSYESLPGHERYTMYETIREYAAEKMDLFSKEEAAALRQRHGSHYAELGSWDFVESLYTHGGVEQQQLLTHELENLQAGVDWGTSHSNSDVAPGCAVGLSEIYSSTGPYLKVVELLDNVLSLDGIIDDVKSRLLWRKGMFLARTNQINEGLTALEKSLAINIKSGNRLLEGYGYVSVATHNLNIGTSPLTLQKAEEYINKAYAIVEEVHDTRLEAWTKKVDAYIIFQMGGNYEKAIELQEVVLKMHQEMGDHRGVGTSLMMLGENCLEYLDRSEESLAHFQAALSTFRDVGDRRREGVSHRGLGMWYTSHEQFQTGAEHFKAAIEIGHEVGDLPLIGLVTGHLGESLMELGQLEQAETYLRASISQLKNSFPDWSISYQGELAVVLAKKGKLDEANTLIDGVEKMRLSQAKEARGATEISKLGVLYCYKAQIAHVTGNRESAYEALAKAETNRKDVEKTLGLTLQPTNKLNRELKKLKVLLPHREKPRSS